MIQMVPRGGIEPTTLSLEGFCSSTELPGHKILKILEFLDFDDFLFCEERIVRNSRKSNRFLYLFFFRTPLFYNSSSTLCCRHSIEIVNFIYINNLPPFLCHVISDDYRYDHDKSKCFSRHGDIGEAYDRVAIHDLVIDETIDRREIESREHEY